MTIIKTLASVIQKAGRKWTLIAMLALLAAGIGYSAAAEANETEVIGESVNIRTDKWAIVPDGAFPEPVIDGVLDDSIWSSAAEIEGFTTVYSDFPVVDGPSYKLALDGSRLYIGGSFTREEGESLAFVQLILRLPQQLDHLYLARIPVSTSDRMNAFDVGVGGVTPVYVSDVTSAVYKEVDRFVVEAYIPLQSLSVTQTEAGEEWQLNIIHAQNINSRPILSWVPVRNAIYHDTRDKVLLQASVADQDRLGSAFIHKLTGHDDDTWQPEEMTLEYLGFQEKKLSFLQPDTGSYSYQIMWQSPLDGWQQLIPINQTVQDSRVTLKIEHPAPLSFGLYRLQLVAESVADPQKRYFARLVFDRDDLIATGNAGYSPPPGPVPLELEMTPASAKVLEIMGLIPDKVGFRFVGLPEMPELNPDSLFSLSPDGQSLVSKKTSTVYPNFLYPETQSVLAVDGKGNPIEYPYYEDETGKRYFFSAHLWYLQRQGCFNGIPYLVIPLKFRNHMDDISRLANVSEKIKKIGYVQQI